MHVHARYRVVGRDVAAGIRAFRQVTSGLGAGQLWKLMCIHPSSILPNAISRLFETLKAITGSTVVHYSNGEYSLRS